MTTAMTVLAEASCDEAVTWPGAVLVLGIFATIGFVAWVMFR